MTPTALSLPTTSPLSSSVLLSPANPQVLKTLLRLSRPSLLSLVTRWLSHENLPCCRPILGERESDSESTLLHEPAYSISEVRDTYASLSACKGSKREVVDRILECDWRDGISLRQLAIADIQYLLDHPTSIRWAGCKFVPASTASNTKDGTITGKEKAATLKQQKLDEQAKHDDIPIPHLHPSTFLTKLHNCLSPLLKAHYHIQSHPTLPLTILRILICHSPYSSPSSTAHLTSLSCKTIYAAFPSDVPYVYISIASPPLSSKTSSGSGDASKAIARGLDTKSTRALVLDAIPQALSQRGARYKLQNTRLSAKNLEAILASRGPGRGNRAGGGWSVFAEGKAEGGVLDVPPNNANRVGEEQNEDEDKENIGKTEERVEGEKWLKRKLEEGSREIEKNKDERIESGNAAKRRKLVAAARFGLTARPDDGKGIDRFSVRVEEPWPDSATSPSASDHSSASANAAHHTTTTTPSKARKQRRRRSALSLLEDSSIISSLEEPRDAEDGAEVEGLDQSMSGVFIPKVQLTFQGSHVFAGIRALVEAGVVDGKRMPGWMTGEEGVSFGVVRRGELVSSGKCL